MIRLKNGEGMIWPEGKRIALLLTFDFDAELLRYSVIGQENTGFSDISRGKYGPDEGLKRCLAMLERQQLKTTFFVPGKIAELYPEQVQQIAHAGHELAYHGYAHDNRVGIPLEEEQANMAQSEKLLERISAHKVVGYRGPLDVMQPCSLELLQKRGYLYGSTLKDCDWPYIHEQCKKETPIVELPTEPSFDDFSFFYFSYADGATITCSYPSQYVYELWKDNFDELASENDKVMVLKLHPQLIGRSGRIRMLERFLAYARVIGAWVASCAEVARYVLKFYQKGGAAHAMAR
ncbi:MAG: polysaccharide deacetylase family protein [Acidaminococcaceae bacterium]|nr:polysaccharide deacetylase family protein [Acidaminococcaceae bacterium]